MLIAFFFIAQVAMTWWAENLIKTNALEMVQKNTMAASQLNKLAGIAQQIRRYEKG